MGFFDRFKRKLTHNEKVLLAYAVFKPDRVEMLFPGKQEQADKIITSLGKVADLNLEVLEPKDYFELLKIYAEVLIRKVDGTISDAEIAENLQKGHGQFVQSSDMAKKIVTYTALNMLNHDFVAKTQDDIDSLAEDIVAGSKKTEAAEESDVKVGFYFENILELAIYGRLFGAGKTVIWLKGDLYLSQYQKGYQLVEERKYHEAITVLNASLKVNPIGISSRFELCECYIRLNDFEKARKLLMDMSAYLLDAKHIAKFYRRIGYIEIERGNNLAAAACYVYSGNFEKHPSIEKELQYIEKKTGVSVKSDMDATKILEKYEIPILVERKIDDIQAP